MGTVTTQYWATAASYYLYFFLLLLIIATYSLQNTFSQITSFDIYNNNPVIGQDGYYCFHFTGEEKEAQDDQIRCSSHRAETETQVL